MGVHLLEVVDSQKPAIHHVEGGIENEEGQNNGHISDSAALSGRMALRGPGRHEGPVPGVAGLSTCGCVHVDAFAKFVLLDWLLVPNLPTLVGEICPPDWLAPPNLPGLVGKFVPLTRCSPYQVCQIW